MTTILISGGTGLIGKRLTERLRGKGYQVRILSRKSGNVDTVKWDIENGYIDPNALQGVDAIIHLAGEGIADKAWTDHRKAEIINSRVNSTKLLYSTLQNTSHQVKQFISASATGFYSDRADELMHEDSSPANDFLGKTCVAWEESIDKISTLGIRTVKLRTGIVLTIEGGALKKMITPFKFGFGSALGNGKQWMSWIHEDDLCDMYIFALENHDLHGAYNAVSPEVVTNTDFSRTLAKVLNMPFWAPNVPAFILKLIFGEMSAVVLGSTKASADKIISTGFKFKYPNLKDCLIALLKK